MEWDDLKYVLATSRSGSFLGAGHLLKVAHTTVGRRIKALEEDLGQPLFKRTRDGVEATELCLRILPAAEDIEQQIRQIALTTESEVSEPSGTVRIHTAAWIFEHLLIPALPEFIARYPKVQLFFYGDVVDAFYDNSVPYLSIRFDVMAKRNEIEKEIVEIPFSAYRHIESDLDSLLWASTHGGTITMKTTNWLEQQGVTPDQIGLFVNDAELLKAAILTRRFKGLIPHIITRGDTNLTRIFSGPPDLTRTLRFIAPRRVLTLPEVQAVLSWLPKALAHNQAPKKSGPEQCPGP